MLPATRGLRTIKNMKKKTKTKTKQQRRQLAEAKPSADNISRRSTVRNRLCPALPEYGHAEVEGPESTGTSMRRHGGGVGGGVKNNITIVHQTQLI